MVTLINSYVICVKHEEKRLFLFSYQTYSPFFGGKDILDLGETSASLCLSNIAISKKSTHPSRYCTYIFRLPDKKQKSRWFSKPLMNRQRKTVHTVFYSRDNGEAGT